jgi:hypothetical protein
LQRTFLPNQRGEGIASPQRTKTNRTAKKKTGTSTNGLEKTKVQIDCEQVDATEFGEKEHRAQRNEASRSSVTDRLGGGLRQARCKDRTPAEAEWPVMKYGALPRHARTQILRQTREKFEPTHCGSPTI